MASSAPPSSIPPPATASGPRTHSLNRQVGLIGLLWASEGSIIGSGWLFGAQGALAQAGPAALISWGIAAVIIILIALVHAELGGMFPISGGTARFPHYAFGGAAGASFGWFSWLQAAATSPVEVIAMIQYAQHWQFAHNLMYTRKALGSTQHMLSAEGICVAVVLMAVFVAVNFLGIRMLARVNSLATWWKVGVPLLTIFALSIAGFHTGNFTANGGFFGSGAKSILQAIPLSGIVFALLGFEQAIQLAGESENPRKHLPRATVLSILIGASIYILVQLAFIGALPASQIAGGWANAAFTDYSAPFAAVATLAGLGWLAAVLYVDAVISPGGTGLIYSTTTSRISYGLARNGHAPAIYARTDRRQVPWFGLITSFVVGCVFFLPFPSWQSMVQLATSASVLMYAGAPLAFGVFRDRLPGLARPYRLPGGALVAPVAFVLANEIVLWAGYDTVYKLGISVLAGYLVLILCRVMKLGTVTPRLDYRAAQWLPVYLLGMGVLAWLSSFDTGGAGSLTDPPLHFGWDMAAVAVFSVLIYFWARRVALPAERIQEMIDEVILAEAGH